MQESINAVRILSFESSCDDTSVALVKAQNDQLHVLSMAVQSQNEVHEKFGGVVPELASRAHLENLIPCLQKVLKESGCRLEEVDAFAATARPGLIGCLLVAHTAAKTLSMIYQKPFISCHHLEGHLASIDLEAKAEYPLLCLLVSGGHSSIYYLRSGNDYDLLAQTLDDACGEAFDKGAKLLGLGFPGGAALELLAREGDPGKYEFGVVRVAGLDMSFSGLKSQLNRIVQKQAQEGGVDAKNLAASYQLAILDHLMAKLNRALEEKPAVAMAIVGGVARNEELRKRVSALAEKHRVKQVLMPSPKYCTDNAAMIGALAYRKYRAKQFSDLKDDVGSTSRPAVKHGR
jgi:N6-L-threonylcarbamoyladenine synthase